MIVSSAIDQIPVQQPVTALPVRERVGECAHPGVQMPEADNTGAAGRDGAERARKPAGLRDHTGHTKRLVGRRPRSEHQRV